MIALGLVPVAASVMLALASGGLSRHLAPAVAVPLLTLLALATSLATGLVLSLAAFGAVAQLPFLAERAGWSGGVLAPGNLEPGWGVLPGAIAAALLTAALIFTVRAARDLARAGRACRQLGGLDRLVITHDDRPTAYSVPTRAGAIVVSTGMLRLLSAEERRALLAHEDSHLRHRHALYVLLADLSAAANPLLRPLAGRVRLAVELQADEDAVAEIGDRRAVARALARASLAVSAGPGRRRAPAAGSAAGAGPRGSLAMAQTDACARIRALTEPRRRRSWPVAAALVLILASSTTALTMTWAMHQRIEAAQLVYAESHAIPLPDAAARWAEPA
ncbi:MAG TPA: M56 family metallopeptidase [Streptosporangiaceae bacterium]|nr:M56 family metallopeptidase [Streptosporangiaceae bacterium]